MVVLAFVNNIAWQWSLTQSKQRTLEDIVLTILIIKETKGTATAGSIIDYLGYHLVHIVKEQLVADTNLAGWFYQYIPETHFLIQLAKQEHLYLGISLLLGTIETSRENFRIIEDKGITLIEIVDDVLKLQEYWIALSIDHVIAFSILLVHFDLL